MGKGGISEARVPLALLAMVMALAAWSYIDPHDSFIWWLEAAPALAAITILVPTYRSFRLTDMAYCFLALHCVLLLVGAHYTYAEVPGFAWLRDEGFTTRNHYDRLGHFAQGVIPALVGRELLLRTSPLKPGKWLFVILTLSCLGISAAYELLEWLVCVTTGDRSTSFLGLQGDEWDTQKDMALAATGAMVSQLVFARWHDRVLARFTWEKRGNA